MKFGLFSLMTARERDGGKQILDDTKAMVQLAEDLGFETAWFAEHHFSNYSMCVSPLVAIAQAAEYTKRIGLGPGVLVLPLYHPIRMIEEMGLVDLMSDGRLVVGIGTGYQQFEFDRFGAALDERVERSVEIIEIMEKAYAGEHVSFSGKHYQFSDFPVFTRLKNGRRPTVYAAGAHPDYLRKVVEYGYVPFVTVGCQPRSALYKVREAVEKQFAAGGRDPRTMPFAIQRYVYVTDDRADALDAAERILYVNRLAVSMRFNYQKLDGAMLEPLPFENEPSLEDIVDNVIIGSAEHCAERITEEAKGLKPTHFSCFMQFGGMDRRRAIRSMERFGAEVQPEVERALQGTRQELEVLG